MTQIANSRTGGQILIDQLVAQGAEHVFCVPGESYLAALDAMHDAPLTVTVCRQEAGAAMMAIANARLVDRPGICFVTRGPGATNAAHGVYIAQHDSVPLILFVGQVERGMLGRGAFQEMDYPAFFGSTTKWTTQIEDPARIPEIVQRAYHVAMQGRPGPVVIALPEDVLTERADVRDAPRVTPAPIWPGPAQMAELQKMLAIAERPVAILGGVGWSDPGRATFQRFVERFDLPVAVSFRRASLFDGNHPNYCGEIGIGPNPKLKSRIASADLVLLVGGRMSEMPSQAYTLFGIPAPRQKLVHVYPDPLEIGRVYHPVLGIVATADAFCAAVEGLQPPAATSWSDDALAARPPSRGRDRHQRRWKLRDLAGTFFALRTSRRTARADLRIDGFRRARRGRRQAHATGSHGRVILRGRLLLDERTGIRDRSSIRLGDRLHRDRQRHVRHDPHASGAGISRTRQGHGD